MNDIPQNEPLSASKITWAALLAHWVQFARSALALPDDDQADRIRRSVPDIIMLQAVWFALDDLNDLPVSQRALGLDRAEILIDKHSKAILDRWNQATQQSAPTPPAAPSTPSDSNPSGPSTPHAPPPALPQALEELINDARDRLVSTSR